jgi:hypothetical protein
MLRDEVARIWPELEWIADPELRRRTTDCWVRAFELSPLSPADLERIPFTLKVPDCPVSFMAHKRAVVHVARDAGRTVQEFFGDALPVDMDVQLAGAILPTSASCSSTRATAPRQPRDGATVPPAPFTGVALAMECGLPDAVSHIVAAHAGEGNLVARTTEAWIVHHADFMTFEPFVRRLQP